VKLIYCITVNTYKEEEEPEPIFISKIEENENYNNFNMKVLRMVSFEEGQNYIDCHTQNNFNDFWEFVKEYLVKKKIKMTGPEHHGYGVPIIEYNGKIFAFSLSYRKWGEIMAEAFEPDNKDEMAYCNWAWTAPDGETSWMNHDYK